MTILQAILCGLLYYEGRSWLFYHTLYITGLPLPIGFIVGAIFGDVQTGALVGAAVQPMYLANYAVGGTVVNDAVAAGIVPAALVLGYDMSIDAAVAIAVPFGLLGSQMDQLCQICIANVMTLADRSASRGDSKGVAFYGGYLPQIIKLVILAPTMAILLYYGGTTITTLVNNLPVWAENGLHVIANVLPALGYAMIMTTIGRKELLPYFAAGFIFASYTGSGAIALVCLGAFLGYIHIRSMKTDPTSVQSASNVDALKKPNLLTSKDIKRFFWGYWVWASGSHNPFKLHALGLGIPMTKISDKLYADDPEELKAAYLRHTMTYLTNFNIGGIIAGAVVSMEEQRAADRETMPAEAIINVKNALMGPFAAIGDTLDGGTMMPICLGLGTTLVATSGFTFAAILLPILYLCYSMTEMWLSVHFGYKWGKDAALTFMKSNSMKPMLEFMSVMGMFTLAGISATMMRVSFAININNGGATPIALQSVFDKIMPGVLSLAVLFGIYSYLSKGGKMTRAMVFILVAGFILGAFGILG